jgi:hypothetical protein
MHRRLRPLASLLLPLAALVLTAAPAISAPARTAEVHDCHVYSSYPNVLISSARNMSCRSAKSEMRSYRGSINYRFTTPRQGFRCRRVSGQELGGQWRCTRDSRAFRFDFGD